jgi:predicted metal-dependent RNase
VLASGRAQEVLTILRRNIQLFNDIGVPIFVDGRSIYAYNDIFSYLSRIYPELFRVRDQDYPGWRGLADNVFQEVPAGANQRFKGPGRPKIVVVSGGMGLGPATDYIRGIGSDERSKVIFTCYQVSNSRGAKLLAHAANPDADPRLRNFKAQVKACRLSGHNSGAATLNFIKESLKPGGTVVFVHGSIENLEALRDAVTIQGHAGRVVVAETGKTIQLW